MMSSEISTDSRAAGAAANDDGGFQPWHFFLLIAMLAAIVGVILSRHTEPAALIILSAAIIAAGVAGIALHYAVAALVLKSQVIPSSRGVRFIEALDFEKRHVLRAIKEIEFDHRMGKMSEKDLGALVTPLRQRAMVLM